MFLKTKLVIQLHCGEVFINLKNKVRIDNESSILLTASPVQTFLSVGLIQNSVY